MGTLFPTQTQETPQLAKKPKVIFWKWTLIATGLFMAYLLWECGSGLYQGSRLANESVQRFHHELNDGQYEQIYQEADAGFRDPEKHDEIVKFLRGVHTKLGNATSERFSNMRVNATTEGTFIITTYTSTFSAGTAEETFTWVKNGTGLKLYGYNIQLNAFILN